MTKFKVWDKTTEEGYFVEYDVAGAHEAAQKYFVDKFQDDCINDEDVTIYVRARGYAKLTDEYVVSLTISSLHVGLLTDHTMEYDYVQPNG